MSFGVRLLKKRPEPELAVDSPKGECDHWELAPRWDSAADMGHADRVTHYVCAACGERVSREQAQARNS